MVTSTIQFIRQLALTQVGDMADYSGATLTPALSTEGCEGCVFDTEEKANGCDYKASCMAHLRKDRESVIFANGIER